MNIWKTWGFKVNLQKLWNRTNFHKPYALLAVFGFGKGNIEKNVEHRILFKTSILKAVIFRYVGGF